MLTPLRPSVSDVCAVLTVDVVDTAFRPLECSHATNPPGGMRALDYEWSELAAPLAELLDLGLTLVPELTFGALLGVSEPEAPE
jgi:hypothetical protein